MMAAPAGEELRALAERLEREQTEAGVDCVATVRQMTGLFRDATHREIADKSVFQILLRILERASHEIEAAGKDTGTQAHLDPYLLLLSECFRCLRNACIQCARNQDVMRSLGLIDASVHLIQLLQKLETDLESLLTAFRCSFQFLGNIATGNADSQARIWEIAFPSVFLNCLNLHDEKIIAYCSMVLFTCLNPERTGELQEEDNLNVALAVLQASKWNMESEWMLLIVTNHFLKCPELVKAVYAKLSNQERNILLEMILSEMSGKASEISTEIAAFLASCFEEKCQSVLRLASAAGNEDEEALVTIRLLDVLCEMTSADGQLGCLQGRPGLLDVAVTTLKLAHLSGKQTANIFTVTHSSTGKEQASHPAVGFKSHLIRLIGNLCYKNKANQDKVYELDGIPLILDNCGIDDNNPFVSQWAVYTIRNLTECNERNQELIARMEQKGLADASLLERLGLEVEQRDQKLVLRSARKTPNL